MIVKFTIGKLNVELDTDFICIAKGLFRTHGLMFWTFGWLYYFNIFDEMTF